MLKSTLIEIIRTFSKQELVKFEDFVRSPFFNKKENVVKLFQQIKVYFPDFKDVNLEKEKIWKKLFTGAEYNYGIMKNLIFDLNKLAEQFIIELKLGKDKFKLIEYLMSALLDRSLNNLYNIKYKSFSPEPDLRLINENNLLISDHINFVYEMYNIKLIYQHLYHQDYKLEDLQPDRDSCHIASFLIILFGAYNDAAAIGYYRNTDLEKNPVTKLIELISPGMEIIIESLKETSAANSLYVNIYYHMYRTFSERTEERYFEFKNIFYKNMNLLPRSNMQDLHFYLLNSVHFIKKEKVNGSKEVIEIIDSLVEHNALTDIKNDKIPIHIFNMYISNCFLLNNSEKLELFADRFICKLDPELVSNTKNDVNFRISFINKDYQKALNYLSLLDIPYLNVKVSLRWQKAMCLYETDDYELFLNEFDSLKHFNRNSKIISEEGKAFLIKHFSVTKRLFNLRQNFDRHEYLKLKKEISAEYNNSFTWFQDKLDELVVSS